MGTCPKSARQQGVVQSGYSRGIHPQGIFKCVEIGCGLLDWFSPTIQEGGESEEGEDEDSVCTILVFFFLLLLLLPLFFFNTAGTSLPLQVTQSPHFGTRTRQLKFRAAGKTPKRMNLR